MRAAPSLRRPAANGILLLLEVVHTAALALALATLGRPRGEGPGWARIPPSAPARTFVTPGIFASASSTRELHPSHTMPSTLSCTSTTSEALALQHTAAPCSAAACRAAARSLPGWALSVAGTRRAATAAAPEDSAAAEAGERSSARAARRSSPLLDTAALLAMCTIAFFSAAAAHMPERCQRRHMPE